MALQGCLKSQLGSDYSILYYYEKSWSKVILNVWLWEQDIYLYRPVKHIVEYRGPFSAYQNQSIRSLFLGQSHFSLLFVVAATLLVRIPQI